MGRPALYTNADTILARCEQKDGCFIWPGGEDGDFPAFSPSNPLAKLFGTNSVVRVLFMICRFPPAGKRLVKLCTSHYCVNPYHHTESKSIRARRAQLSDPLERLEPPSLYRHLIIPPEDQVARLRPINPLFVRLLAESAARVGLTEKSRPKNMADPEKPVLVLNRRGAKPEPEPEPEKTYYGPEQRDKPAPIDDFVALLEQYGQR
jgi:hypothetical protein